MGSGKSKGAVKEIATLRKFLHKNQDKRFTDKEVSRLFDSIQLYVHKEDLESEHKEGLLEDALKMPFTVFSTKQKKSMLKWLESLRGGEVPKKSQAGSSQQAQVLSIIDLVEGKLSLMDDETGDTYEDISLPLGELGAAIQSAFEETDGVISVRAEVDDDGVIKILCLNVTE